MATSRRCSCACRAGTHAEQLGAGDRGAPPCGPLGAYGARLVNANLAGANFTEAGLDPANLTRANLSGADLTRARLGGANLTNATLDGTNLDGADFSNTILLGARLTNCKAHLASINGADLRHAYAPGLDLAQRDLDGTSLQCAVLTNAQLSSAISMLAAQIAGANVTNAKLPKEIGAFESLKLAEEAAKNSRAILYLMLSGCAYAWLTVAATTDEQLLTNAATAQLPIIGTTVPILWFFYVAPGLGTCQRF